MVNMNNLEYLKIISKQYPSLEEVTREIINLSAIINLPKGTEHFLTDLHGEYEAFSHVLRNASGVVRRKIDEAFKDTLKEEEKNELASLIYYPKNKLIYLNKKNVLNDTWYFITIYRLILVLRKASFKYTRSKVRKSLPKDFRYIIEELLQENEDADSKKEYYSQIINTIVESNISERFIIELSKAIRRLVIDRLHILGDIYDRGNGAHQIMDELIKLRSVDIEWGNHDILWMGAAAGNAACIFNVLRIALRYANLKTLQDGYGINLLPLAQFVEEIYVEDETELYSPKLEKNHILRKRDLRLLSKMQKAVSIIQFKLEGEIIKNHPEYDMDDRLLLDKIIDNEWIEIEGERYRLKDTYFPTLNKQSPYDLTIEEKEIVDGLILNFKHSEKLQEHIKFLYSKGSLYKAVNGNLLFHAVIPTDDNGKFTKLKIGGKDYCGKELLDYFDYKAREAYFLNGADTDVLWYLWCGKYSPLFGKDKMTTFERLFLNDESVKKEKKNAYYKFRDSEEFMKKILVEFGLDENGVVVNGHVPVKEKKGENPIKANGKLLVIDGGFSKAYQKVTGIAGYTLTYNSKSMILVSHKPFSKLEDSVYSNVDFLPKEIYVKNMEKRMLVGDTDTGKEIKNTIKILKELMEIYSTNKELD